ncbi:hypothetical protein FACS189434_14010 [Bacteroidia bacterium]|nr:hypothetical protein FACS189434_14010 [Bacteroidia bacterium]
MLYFQDSSSMEAAYGLTITLAMLMTTVLLYFFLREGVFVGTQGPTYETPAEYRYLRLIGGDSVAMSTVPEVIVARHAGMRCFAVSIITDLGVAGKIAEISHEEVQAIAAAAEPKMTVIIKGLVEEL